MKNQLMSALTVITIIAASVLIGCSHANTQFKPYEAKHNEFEGKGGTKTVVKGMDFWENGEPPRKFTVLGIIEDQRSSGSRSMGALREDVATLARESGGEAVVELGSQSQISSYYSMPSGSSTVTVPIRRNSAKFAVIKYLD